MCAMTKKSVVIQLLDDLVPASIRHQHNVSAEELMRAKAMVAVLAISIILPLVVLTNYLILQATTENDFTRNIYILMGVEIWLVSQHLYFQSYGNLRLTAGIYSAQYLLTVLITTLISGGWNSPLLVLLLGSPMIAYMTVSYGAALLHVALAVLIVVFLLTLYHFQITLLPDISHPANHAYNRFIAWDMVLLLFAAFLVILEHLVRSRK